MWGVEDEDLGTRHQCRGCGYEFTIRSLDSRCPKCGLFVKTEGLAMLTLFGLLAIALLLTLLGLAR